LVLDDQVAPYGSASDQLALALATEAIARRLPVR